MSDPRGVLHAPQASLGPLPTQRAASRRGQPTKPTTAIFVTRPRGGPRRRATDCL